MSKQKPLKRQGRHIELPIKHYSLAELRLGMNRLPLLLFRSDMGEEAELQIGEEITLARGQCQDRLTGSRPSSTFAPQTLGPLVELLGCTVTEATALQSGEIRIHLSNAIVLSIAPSHGYEGWHFRWKTNRNHPASLVLHGADGHLIS
ncbi:MAG: hypothetical protein KDA84_10485 [Planctomycetaceae bacterium]|nr:hypothetical protein [Planctomycetaceae bacterium]